MKMKRMLLRYTLLLLVLCAADISADEIPKGVIVAKSLKKQTITVRNLETGKRHTYFLNETTRLSSQGESLSFDDVAAGQAVALSFERTDIGRELNFVRVPDLDERVELEAIDSAEDLFISGVVTGVRLKKRSITIRGPNTTQRLTIHIPEDISLTRASKPIKLEELKVGDVVEFRHHETSNGLVILSGEVSAQTSN